MDIILFQTHGFCLNSHEKSEISMINDE